MLQLPQSSQDLDQEAVCRAMFEKIIAVYCGQNMQNYPEDEGYQKLRQAMQEGENYCDLTEEEFKELRQKIQSLPCAALPEITEAVTMPKTTTAPATKYRERPTNTRVALNAVFYTLLAYYTPSLFATQLTGQLTHKTLEHTLFKAAPNLPRVLTNLAFSFGINYFLPTYTPRAFMTQYFPILEEQLGFSPYWVILLCILLHQKGPDALEALFNTALFKAAEEFCSLMYDLVDDEVQEEQPVRNELYWLRNQVRAFAYKPAAQTAVVEVPKNKGLN